MHKSDRLYVTDAQWLGITPTYCGEVPLIIGSKKILKSGGLTKLQDLKIEGISAISYADEYR
ncbi:MAG: hypothetical protein P8L31_07515 [Pseudomonadales bacterium]|jgi:hypothetical protein|nr:hypothetical protein [Pseudomonadales bacterium]